MNYSDISGGAARAAYRLLNALNNIGIDTQMLVAQKKSDDARVITINRKRDFVHVNLMNFLNNRKLINTANQHRSQLCKSIF